MSLSEWKATIEPGQVCIIYEGIDRLQHFVPEPGGILNNRYGSFYHDDILGQPYGIKWVARSGTGGKRRRKAPAGGEGAKGFVYVLHPTPELWTYALPHRTQIIYTPDISYITMQLELKPGAVVLETGTGSGSLTCALARTVLPTGHVHTFEYHEERAQRARDDFALLGLSDAVTVTLRDTMANGFPDELAGQADAVFLDLPGPWEVVRPTLPALWGALCAHRANCVCGLGPGCLCARFAEGGRQLLLLFAVCRAGAADVRGPAHGWLPQRAHGGGALHQVREQGHGLEDPGLWHCQKRCASGRSR